MSNNIFDPADPKNCSGHHDICRCVICPTGPQGPRGPVTMVTGPTGPTGPAGAGAIIPFASGGATTLTTVLGEIGTQSAVAFGNFSTLALGGVIDLAGLSSMALSMPRDGIITSMAAYYSVALGVSLVGSTVTITAQMYSSPTPDDTFAPIPGALVILAPPLTGVVALGEITSGVTTGLAIPVTAGTRLLLVFTATVTAGTPIAATVTGFASGGLNIT